MFRKHSEIQLSLVLHQRHGQTSYERIGMVYQRREATRRERLSKLPEYVDVELEPLLKTLTVESRRVEILRKGGGFNLSKGEVYCALGM